MLTIVSCRGQHNDCRLHSGTDRHHNGARSYSSSFYHCTTAGSDLRDHHLSQHCLARVHGTLDGPGLAVPMLDIGQQLAVYDGSSYKDFDPNNRYRRDDLYYSDWEHLDRGHDGSQYCWNPSKSSRLPSCSLLELSHCFPRNAKPSCRKSWRKNSILTNL